MLLEWASVAHRLKVFCKKEGARRDCRLKSNHKKRLCTILKKNTLRAYIVGWSLHNSLDTSNCIEVLKKAFSRHGVPEIINSDQGCQFTGKEWADPCSRHSEMKVSMDGRGRAKDNIWIERFCKTIKYEYIYIQPEENGADLFFGIKRFIDDYNYHRRHQGINRTVPSKLYIRQAAWS